MSLSSLHCIYKKHNIRFKLIQRVKKVIDFTNPDYKSMFMTMVELFESASKEQTPVVYLVEAVFTFKAKSWSSPYTSIKVNNFAAKVKT